MENTITLTRDNYYDIGNDRDLVISNSSLAYINPNQGGSLLRFKKYLAGDNEKKDSRSLERGKLLHSYMENRDNFVIEEGNKPSVAISAIISLVYDRVKEAGEEFGTLDNHEDKLSLAASELEYQTNWKTLTIVTKLKVEGEAYYQFLISANGKIMLDAATKDCLLNMITTIEMSEHREELIDRKVSDYSTPYLAYLGGDTTWTAKEYPVLFDMDGIRCKSLLDYVHFDFIKKTVTLRDLKTTSQPVSKFMGTTKFGMDPETTKIFMDITNGSFQNYHYYRQMAFYLEAIKSLTNLLPESDGYRFGVVMDVVETVDPYEMVTYGVPPQWIHAGTQEIRSLMELVKTYIKAENIETL